MVPNHLCAFLKFDQPKYPKEKWQRKEIIHTDSEVEEDEDSEEEYSDDPMEIYDGRDTNHYDEDDEDDDYYL